MTLRPTVAVFGAAEKGQFKKPYFLHELVQLIDIFGISPPEGQGLFYAIQTLLFQRNLIFFRVEEEGFSVADYFCGLKYLECPQKIKHLSALCLPGIGDPAVLEFTQNICKTHKSLLIISPQDLFDYLTSYNLDG